MRAFAVLASLVALAAASAPAIYVEETTLDASVVGPTLSLRGKQFGVLRIVNVRDVAVTVRDVQADELSIAGDVVQSTVVIDGCRFSRPLLIAARGGTLFHSSLSITRTVVANASIVIGSVTGANTTTGVVLDDNVATGVQFTGALSSLAHVTISNNAFAVVGSNNVAAVTVSGVVEGVGNLTFAENDLQVEAVDWRASGIMFHGVVTSITSLNFRENDVNVSCAGPNSTGIAFMGGARDLALNLVGNRVNATTNANSAAALLLAGGSESNSLRGVELVAEANMFIASTANDYAAALRVEGLMGGSVHFRDSAFHATAGLEHSNGLLIHGNVTGATSVFIEECVVTASSGAAATARALWVTGAVVDVPTVAVFRSSFATRVLAASDDLTTAPESSPAAIMDFGRGFVGVGFADVHQCTFSAEIRAPHVDAGSVQVPFVAISAGEHCDGGRVTLTANAVTLKGPLAAAFFHIPHNVGLCTVQLTDNVLSRSGNNASLLYAAPSTGDVLFRCNKLDGGVALPVAPAGEALVMACDVCDWAVDCNPHKTVSVTTHSDGRCLCECREHNHASMVAPIGVQCSPVAARRRTKWRKSTLQTAPLSPPLRQVRQAEPSVAPEVLSLPQESVWVRTWQAVKRFIVVFFIGGVLLHFAA